MSQPAEVPFTIASALETNYTFEVVIGKQTYSPPGQRKTNSYWFSVYDRYTLAQVFSQTQADDADSVPADLTGKYNTDQYMLFVATCGLLSAYAPAGKLYQFLVDNGAATALKRLVQVYQQIGCGSLGISMYALSGVLGAGLPAQPGVEAASVDARKDLYLAGTLVGAQIGEKTLYTPVALTRPTLAG